MRIPFAGNDSRFGSTSNNKIKTAANVFLVVIVVTRNANAKAAVKSPEPTVYIMMRLTIELVLLERISGLWRRRRITIDKAIAVSTHATRADQATRLVEVKLTNSDCA